MQRNYFRGFLICLIPTLVALYFTVFGEKKKGIDLAGGTILVFEVDKEKTNERLKNEGGSAGFGQSEEDLKKLAEDAMKQTRLLVNNPRELSFDDALAIYTEAFGNRAAA
jgi:preprotein translocase subunit SecF